MAEASKVWHRDPEILGGTPAFVGTRVPVQSLFDYLEAGDPLDEFLRQFPSVKREQAVGALRLASRALLGGTLRDATAEEALAELREGRTEPLDPDKL